MATAPNPKNPGQKGHSKTGDQDQGLCPFGQTGQASFQDEEKAQPRQRDKAGVARIKRGVLVNIGSIAQNTIENQGAGALNNGADSFENGQVPKRSGCGDQGFFQRGFFFEEEPGCDQHDQSGKILDYIAPKVSLDVTELKNDPIQKVDLVDQAGGRGGGAPRRVPVDPHEKQKRP